MRDGLGGGSRHQGLHETDRRCATATEHQRLVKKVDGGGPPERLSEGSDWGKPGAVCLQPIDLAGWRAGPSRAADHQRTLGGRCEGQVVEWDRQPSRSEHRLQPVRRGSAHPLPGGSLTGFRTNQARGQEQEPGERSQEDRQPDRTRLRSRLPMDGQWRRGIRASPRSRPSGPDRADPRTARPEWSQSAHSVAQRAQLAGLGRYQSAQQQNPKEGARPCDRVEVVQEAI